MSSFVGLAGAVYVQGGLRGLASYHFGSVDEGGAVAAYISYEAAECAMWGPRDDGSAPPARAPFVGGRFDAGTRTFTGRVVWAPTWHGDALWDYEMVFAGDWASIASGRVAAYGPGGAPSHVSVYGTHLRYTRALEAPAGSLRGA